MRAAVSWPIERRLGGREVAFGGERLGWTRGALVGLVGQQSGIRHELAVVPVRRRVDVKLLDRAVERHADQDALV